MGWIVWYVIFIPLIGGAIWAANRKIKEKKANSQELERIQRRIAEKELEAKRAGLDT